MDELYVLMFLIGMIVSITFLGMATFAYKKGNGKAKKRYILSGVFAIIAVLGIYGLSQNPPDKDVLETAESTPPKVEDYNSVAITIDEQFRKYVNEIQPNELRALDAIIDFEAGKIDSLSAYEKISDMKEQYLSTYLSISKVSIPENLPDDLINDLQKIQSGIVTNYFTRLEAMNHFLDYIDTQNNSDLDKMSQQLELSTLFVKQVHQNSASLHSKVGLQPSHSEELTVKIDQILQTTNEKIKEKYTTATTEKRKIVYSLGISPEEFLKRFNSLPREEGFKNTTIETITIDTAATAFNSFQEPLSYQVDITGSVNKPDNTIAFIQVALKNEGTERDEEIYKKTIPVLISSIVPSISDSRKEEITSKAIENLFSGIRGIQIFDGDYRFSTETTGFASIFKISKELK